MYKSDIFTTEIYMFFFFPPNYLFIKVTLLDKCLKWSDVIGWNERIGECSTYSQKNLLFLKKKKFLPSCRVLEALHQL